ncbi:hypothetical protein V8B55DRAFT_1062574 [Mucor lusitanicus]|nr:hypothetical protein FB192DRAFT_1364684 [Mucor lusitanicus]
MLPTWIRAPWTLDTCIPTAVLLQKSNKRIAWHELVMMYGRLEFLVTGGFWWYKDSNSMNAFLGANIQVIVPAATTTSPIIYTLDPPLTDAQIIKEERLLQNYNRDGAIYKWSVRSYRFCLKGFTATNPLYLTDVNAVERQ